MKPKLFVPVGVIICISLLVGALTAIGGGDYKAYQDRSLSNTLQLQRPDLVPGQIEHLVSLSRHPLMTVMGDSLVITDDEWLFLSDDEIIGVHFRGCRGKLVFNLEEALKKK